MLLNTIYINVREPCSTPSTAKEEEADEAPSIGAARMVKHILEFFF